MCCIVTSLGAYYMDISVERPSGNDCVVSHGSDKTALKSCSVAGKDKVLKYTGKLPNNIDDKYFIPIVLETYGAISATGDSFIN